MDNNKKNIIKDIKNADIYIYASDNICAVNGKPCDLLTLVTDLLRKIKKEGIPTDLIDEAITLYKLNEIELLDRLKEKLTKIKELKTEKEEPKE